ncbi:hypothetical protein M513_11163 [Trichuris suis]|uniref:Uncharacterized protein n=1 Tax=Trichuris suis TaxID=68888 RepID=A0A085LSP0_9BILA|nr:hypothetical protein M513_11163 [Trichuris suis]
MRHLVVVEKDLSLRPVVVRWSDDPMIGPIPLARHFYKQLAIASWFNLTDGLTWTTNLLLLASFISYRILNQSRLLL